MERGLEEEEEEKGWRRHRRRSDRGGGLEGLRQTEKKQGGLCGGQR